MSNIEADGDSQGKNVNGKLCWKVNHFVCNFVLLIMFSESMLRTPLENLVQEWQIESPCEREIRTLGFQI